jgi:uncharacterized protein DUF6968
MNVTSIADVFLEREFEVDGLEGAVKLYVGKPQPDPRSDWYCEYQVVGTSYNKVHKAYGIDSIQALQLALIGANALLGSILKGEHKITWLGEDDLGLLMTEPSPD